MAMAHQWMRTAAAGGLLTAALWGVAENAEAAVYVGSWDPAFGAAFSGLGWRGTATFFVPAACVATGTATVSNAGACGGAAVVQSAMVDFYDLNSPLGSIASIFYGGTSGNPVGIINTLNYVNGLLTEVDSDIFKFFAPTCGLGLTGCNAFALQFTSAGPRLYWSQTNCNPCRGGVNDPNIPPTFTITELPNPNQVPEPTSLALVLATVAAATAASRLGRQRSLKQQACAQRRAAAC
jgi:hypothetical protein